MTAKGSIGGSQDEVDHLHGGIDDAQPFCHAREGVVEERVVEVANYVLFRLVAFRAHSGRSGGFESYLRINENQDLMFFILSNHANGATAELRRILTAKFSEIESNGEF